MPSKIIFNISSKRSKMQAICRVTAIFITLVLGRGHAFFWRANHKQSNKIEPLKTKGATTLSITTFSMITLSMPIKKCDSQHCGT